MEEVRRAELCLDAGSGGRKLAGHVVSVDIVKRNGVDVVADLCAGLPFADGSFDLVVCTSVLEHVTDVHAALSEIVRVTRKGCKLWVEVPFIYHFHTSQAGDTQDFRRWTIEGVKQLLPSCQIVEWGLNVGPGTALRLIAAEVLALPFFMDRHTGMYYLMRWFLSWFLLPLSMLDALVTGKSISHRVAGGFWLLAEKR